LKVETMPAANIRTALATDAADIARLCAQLGYPCTEAEMLSRLNEVIGDDKRAVFVAAGNDGLLGWLEVAQRTVLESGNYAEITGLVVDDAARRCGIGQQLLQAAQSWVREHGFDSLRVRSNTARIESHPFYEKHGFVRQKTQHVYLKQV
jgi:ribosomal protein S18 acetylase RimI-like enzyme